jgi:nucleotide-binding universal stress UspA family protein
MIRITHVLCPVDLSEFSRHALDRAAALALWYEARLTVLYVSMNRPALDVPTTPLTPEEYVRLSDQLRRFTAHVSPEVSLVVTVEEAYDVAQAIVDHADATHADLIVLGTHGRSGVRRLLLGSVAEQVMRRAPVPTFVVPPRAGDADEWRASHFDRILCAVDFSEASLDAVAQALDIAQEANAHLTLVHAVDTSVVPREAILAGTAEFERLQASSVAEARSRLDDLVPAGARAFCDVETIVVEGRPAPEVLRVATERQADLIVLGVHGRGALDRLVFGSVTQAVLHGAGCPVMVVRPACERRPVAA